MLDAHFGDIDDVGDVDLVRATALLAYYSGRTTDRPPATSGFTTICAVALAVERARRAGAPRRSPTEPTRPLHSGASPGLRRVVDFCSSSHGAAERGVASKLFRVRTRLVV